MKHSLKKTLALVNLVVLATALLVTGIALICLPRPTVSELERRELARFPAFSAQDYFSGAYANGIKEYYNDTIPYRDTLKNAASFLMEYKGFRIDNAKIHGRIDKTPDTTDTPFVDDEDWWRTGTETDPPVTSQPTDIEPAETGDPETLPPETASPETDPPETQIPDTETPETQSPETKEPETQAPETTKAPDTEPKNHDEAAISNGVLVYGDRGMALYGGSYSYAQGYAACLAKYHADLGSKVQLYSVTIPTSVAFYLPPAYASYSASQARDLEYLRPLVKDAMYVDVYNALLPHVEEPIYSRTDHHWAPLGAYYAAQEFAKAAGVPFAADLEKDYEKVTVPGYIGTLYSFTHDAALLQHPEDFVYYKGRNTYSATYYSPEFQYKFKGSLFFKTNVSNSYCSFLGTDDIIAVINTDVQNGRKLLIIKDSFGNALVPFLTNSFETIIVTDLRYFKPNMIQFIKDQGVTDVAFALCMQDVFGGWMKNLELIRTQKP